MKVDYRKLIELSGKSRAEICTESGVSISMLSFLESGQRDIGNRNAKALADALGVTPADLRPDLAYLYWSPCAKMTLKPIMDDVTIHQRREF